METKHKHILADFAILVITIIWGLSFTFQKIVSESMPPSLFNSVRYFLGAMLVLLIFLIVWAIKKFPKINNVLQTILGGLVIGFFLFGGSVGQQMGALWTTASKAGFITGFYCLLVPIFAILMKKEKMSISVFIATIFVICGLFFIGDIIHSDSLNRGDVIIFISAFFWAGQIIFIDSFAKKCDILLLAFFVFLFCSIFSLIFSLFTETVTVAKFNEVLWPLFFLAFISTGGAFSLQFFCQKYTPPSHASLIFSTESLFALLGGILILHEKLTYNILIGGGLMFIGILISSLRNLKKSY